MTKLSAKLEFETLRFEDCGERIKAVLLRYFYFEFLKSDLDPSIRIKDGQLYADTTQAKLENRFNRILSSGLLNLKSSLNGKSAVYIHQNSGIPLMGHNAFGIVDRNTSLIEIKPITGCNLNCIFCSVDEGKSSRKVADFVIEKDYLVTELKKLIAFKAIDDIEINIGTNGEPLLYADILPLISDIHKIKEVKVISMNTNGTLLTKTSLDELIHAGLTQLNLSLNALEPQLATKLCGSQYNLENVMKIAEYAAKKMALIIAPVWVPGMNDEEMPKLIEFGKKIGAKYVAIQNFLNYQHGRNPVKQKEWSEFYDSLKSYEKEYGMKLIFSASDFNIRKTDKLPIPFKKDEILKLKLILPGRIRSERLAIAKDRIISVITDSEIGKEIKVKVIRIKHNIIVAKP
jgi:uncharacterized Fe-S cluster-containing radical SAM superfamily enzyme